MSDKKTTLLQALLGSTRSESGKKKTIEDVEIQGEELKQKLQGDFAKWTREIVTAWIIGLGVFFVCLAIYRGNSGERLFSDWILAMLLGTSTATIIGLPLVIIKGLFSSEKNAISPPQGNP